MNYDFCIVGAGFFGSVLAERIASNSNNKILVIDKRPHIGGNCYSAIDKETGIEYHQYGTHIFHTSSPTAWDYITKFTEFNNYHHQVLTLHRNKIYQMPINLETINSFYNCNMRPLEAIEFIQAEVRKAEITAPQNLEEKAISLIGRPLYEAFIKNYTIKQWGKHPSELPASIINRLPIRYNYSENYFNDARWQGIPLDGYTKIFEKLLTSPNIEVKLNCDYFSIQKSISVKKKTIFTGPIDKYFNNRFGKLEWRSVEFTKAIKNVADYQGTSVINFADLEKEYTRVHEPKHLHPERTYDTSKTVIFYENSVSNHEEPFYPIRTEANNSILEKYQKLAQTEEKTVFGGRLGEYSYLDMDKTILAALQCFETQILEIL